MRYIMYRYGALEQTSGQHQRKVEALNLHRASYTNVTFTLTVEGYGRKAL